MSMTREFMLTAQDGIDILRKSSSIQISNFMNTLFGFGSVHHSVTHGMADLVYIRNLRGKLCSTVSIVDEKFDKFSVFHKE